ncbi:54S ribosomal protein L3 mitochondrial [Malassezia cuniculi]|uniref:Large ribosomal subunit protein mL44 n=1 Tax=Malassezia cuniculi TaxID=948313 RepID=A0AAF0ETV3_9BASI|nr:54S ribosomal protein L3 mitochondrial [Malassezia cuniculi]
MRAKAFALPAVRRALSTTVAARNAVPVRGVAPAGHLPAVARKHPELWTSLREQQPSALVTLGARVHLLPPGLTPDEHARRLELVRIACTHPSIHAVQSSVDELPLSVEEREQIAALQTPTDDNAALARLGNSLLGLYAAEYLHIKYPNLPSRVLKAMVSAHVGPSTLADVGTELGILAQGVQRWDRKGTYTTRLPDGTKQGVPLLNMDIAAQSMRALVAVIFRELGNASARAFVHSHFMSRVPNVEEMLKFRDPKRTLADLCRKYGKPQPQSRMIAETGRLSLAPVFVVGVWSGAIKLGEGTGSSIRMAEYRAAENALRRLYGAERHDYTFSVPSTTLDGVYDGEVPPALRLAGEHVTAAPYSPLPLGRTEALHATRG